MDTSPSLAELKEQLKATLVDSLGTGEWGHNRSTLNKAQLQQRLTELLNRQLGEGGRLLKLSPDDREHLIRDIASELVGFGPIEPFMDDPTVGEVMINGIGQVFIERDGRVELTDVHFENEEQLRHLIERWLSSAGASVTEASPYVDASLSDGSRINVILPPLCLNGPTVTIRKLLKAYGMDDWLQLGSLSQKAATFLEACVRAKVNIVISGGTSTGKTTLVSVLSTYLGADERIITIENVSELSLPNRKHWLRLVGRNPNAEGRGEVTIRDLVRNALRMRPDRVILGESRGGEALDMIQAMHTGHEGFFTVLHANSPPAALERLEILMLMSGLDLPPLACRQQIATAIELIVHLERYPDGSRRVARITQVVGLDAQHNFVLQDLFRFATTGTTKQGAITGELQPMGVRPAFEEKLRNAQVQLPPDLFTP